MTAAPHHIELAEPDPVRADIVTASQLVRHFGLWQERATRAPVYVMFRGRARLVLTSIEIMEALVAPHITEREMQGPDPTALLDLINDMVIIADADLRIAAASRTARNYFGDGVKSGKCADLIVPVSSRNTLQTALCNVRSTGVPEMLKLASPRQTNRLLAIRIEPHRRGVALLVQDITAPAHINLHQD